MFIKKLMSYGIKVRPNDGFTGCYIKPAEEREKLEKMPPHAIFRNCYSAGFYCDNEICVTEAEHDSYKRYTHEEFFKHGTYTWNKFPWGMTEEELRSLRMIDEKLFIKCFPNPRMGKLAGDCLRFFDDLEEVEDGKFRTLYPKPELEHYENFGVTDCKDDDIAYFFDFQYFKEKELPTLISCRLENWNPEITIFATPQMVEEVKSLGFAPEELWLAEKSS